MEQKGADAESTGEGHVTKESKATAAGQSTCEMMATIPTRNLDDGGTENGSLFAT